MPRISTDNYDTVASWNGSQDLFIVEQPDGTKVATPAMVKQFMEAGDFEATGEVKDGHGNILKDMAQIADVDAVRDKLITENWTSDRLTDTSNFTFDGFTGNISNGWIYYSKSKSAIIINIFMYITNTNFTVTTGPSIYVKLPVTPRYSFVRLLSGVFGTGATADAVYARRAEDAYIYVIANNPIIQIAKHNFVQHATNGVAVIVTPEIIIPIV